ncbi:hypothetical protein LTR84_000825 [Exophiala bonariae]|uniref:Exonuclease domain-containing protein n=1 Tax=Exophiala bonariae TaxID=1690606 RepID=A0AAV9NS87_9EURO|nr:hypothetical protein LTR84_000825 [Exophiala bonariae]
MTGLDPQTDTILSISVLLTDADLRPIEPLGLTLYITHSEIQLSSMSEWCINTHTSTGLTKICVDPSTSTTAILAAAQVLHYIQTHIPTPRTALLAGNSIHADRSFLMVPPWNAILAHLHYRLFDVSALKEMVRRWAPEDVLAAAPVKMLRHSAREDVLESIDEARFYMALVKSVGGGVPATPLPRPVLTSVPFGNDDAALSASAPAPEPAPSLLDVSTSGGAVSNSTSSDLPVQARSRVRSSGMDEEMKDDTTAQGFRTDVP